MVKSKRIGPEVGDYCLVGTSYARYVGHGIGIVVEPDYGVGPAHAFGPGVSEVEYPSGVEVMLASAVVKACWKEWGMQELSDKLKGIRDE